MKPKYSAFIMALVIFLGGAAGGVLLDRLCFVKSKLARYEHFKKFKGPKRFGKIQHHIQNKMTRRLDLNSEQQEKLRVILEQRFAVMKAKAIEHDKENFTVTVEAGKTVCELQEELEKSGQKVLLMPSGSIGGAIASNPAQNPEVRDQILGIKIALPDGTITEFGAKVMKNVAGYDIPKLLIGSRGYLGVIVSVILKTFPLSYRSSTPVHIEKEKESPDHITESIKTAFDPKRILVRPLER